MAAFLIIYIGVIIYYFRYKKDWYFVLGAGIMVLVIMLLYTYSRSAMIALVVAALVATVFSVRYLYARYKKQILVIGAILVLLAGAIFIKYAGTAQAILGREGSTK